jgi:hypothetical protein
MSNIIWYHSHLPEFSWLNYSIQHYHMDIAKMHFIYRTVI